ncbi:probable methyltransferase TARBP1 isoform X3 [Electrophorus electricus]|uniref:probable methyltransferase TARBP1 isoform X3 n=1 Tax=Electrophorus electricus TaxID=8005 RepID=UPI0015D01656|nr:probable methyltransferase TARBP1 isoform X3 [Electrophorus electricus]
MTSLLLSVLLSQCRDIENVLDALCWPGSSWPEIEKVESLSTLIGELVKKSDSNVEDFKDSETKERFLCKVQSVLWGQCVPLLKMISNAKGDDAQNGKNEQMLSAACGLLGACLSASQTDPLEKMASLVLPALTGSGSRDRSTDTDQLDIDTATEVVVVLLSAPARNAALTVKALCCTLASVKELSDARVSKIIVRVWFACLKSSTEETRGDVLRRAWEDLLSWHDRDCTEAVTARVLLCLTAISDFLFPPDQQRLRDHHQILPDPRTSQPFFRVVQAGLTHRDSVARKRALYLLKKCVSLSESVNTSVCMCQPGTSEVFYDVLFRWTPDQRLVFQEFWGNYALVLETLEENQLHVVRPVLRRLDALTEAAATDGEGGALVHSSWLLCVYQRMFHSENKAVMKDGVNHLLGLRLLRCPAFALSVSKFVVGPFMDVLAEISLYHRSPGQAIGDCPELGLKLQNFMVTFFSSLPKENQGSVLLQLLRRLASPHWCAVPLFFLSRALSHLSPRPLLNADGLHVLREVLRCTIITHQVLLRGATQCFLLHTAICLTDVSEVSLEEVFAFLAHFRADESLRRDTTLWSELRDWLHANEARFRPIGVCAGTTPQRVSVYSSECLRAFLTVPASSADEAEVIPPAGEAEVAACALLLSADADGDGLEQLLRPLLDVLRRLATSAYLPPRKADRSLQVALRLLQLLGPSAERRGESEDKVAVAVRRLLLSVVEPVQEFILRRLNGDLKELRDLDRAALYHSVLGELVKTYCSLPGYLSNLQNNYVSRLTGNCLRILNAPSEQNSSFAGQVQKAVAMTTLALLCELGEQSLFEPQSEATRSLCSLWTYFHSSPSSSSSPPCLTQTLQKPSSSTISAVGGPDDSPLLLRDWGRLAARFVRDQWVCLSFLHRCGMVPVERAGPLWNVASLAAATDALTLLPGCLALPALDFIRVVLPQVVPHEEALCAEAVAASWRLVQASSTNSHDFWPALRAFVCLTFQRPILELTEAQSPELVPRVRQVTGELLQMAQLKSGVLNELIRHCGHTWLPSGPDPLADPALGGALNHLDLLTEACVYGPVFRRDQRTVREVQTYVEQLGEECAANAVIGSATRDDQYPRLCALALLCRLDVSDTLQHSLMEQLAERLLGKDEEISKSKVRYYSNSIQHRVKNRVWQTLLVLLPKLRLGFVAGRVLPATLQAASHANQASVKYLIEWTLILILHLWPTLIHRLWDGFSADREKTKTSVCTLLSVMVHLGVLLPRLENKVEQWQKAVEVVFLRCFSHIFSVRLYALLALKRLWALEAQQAAAHDEATLGASLGGLATAVRACLHQAEVMQSTGNAMKNWSRIQEHFFFSAFHPLNDYSVETIFHTFPRLSAVADDEWVPAWKFEKLVDFRSDSSLPLHNAGRLLSELQPGDWVQQDQGELDQEERWADVQKKIAPWRLSVQEQEPELVAQQRAARLGKLTGALLVVASLIDKPTNLGGLCRTCEIFGASALVLDSLRHISDKQFQALSVSSELWLPLLEVKPMELVDFLQLKKKDGYCIVGVEQTANSESLQDYRFPERTLLLLGNEREGIPARLLQLLDACVEIPQRGVTRSLNVHVSAALLVWEYTKQHAPSGRGA